MITAAIPDTRAKEAICTIAKSRNTTTNGIIASAKCGSFFALSSGIGSQLPLIKCLAFSHLFDDEGGADEVYTNFDYDERNKSRDWSSTRACLQDAHTNDVN